MRSGLSLYYMLWKWIEKVVVVGQSPGALNFPGGNGGTNYRTQSRRENGPADLRGSFLFGHRIRLSEQF